MFFFAQRATFTCSRATKFSFAGHIPFKKNTCSRAADLPFADRIWPAGRSLPTPALNKYRLMHFEVKVNFTKTYTGLCFIFIVIEQIKNYLLNL